MINQPDAGGYIFLWRRTADHPIWRKDEWHIRIWVWLLLEAAHRGNAQHRALPIGACDVTYPEVREGTWYVDERGGTKKVSRRKLNSVLLWMASENMVNYQAGRGKATRIHITNWQKWQHHWDASTSHVALAFNDNGDEGWTADPEYYAAEMMELWGRDNLPNSPHWTSQEMALHNLHHKPPHYSKEQIRQIVMTVKAHAGGGLSWIWKAGPIRLTRPIKSTGQLTAEYVLAFEPLQDRTSNAKPKRTAYRDRRTNIAEGFDLLDELVGTSGREQLESRGSQSIEGYTGGDQWLIQ